LNITRRIFQISIVIAALTVGVRYAMGDSRITVETYCPFGGLEGLLSLVTHHQFTCATGERNLILFIALLVLTLLSRRVFCSWICPVGTLSEGIFRLRKRRRTPAAISRKWDRRLRLIRLPVLLIILFLTFMTGELIFRGVDPYYVLFSIHGHDVQWWSYIVIGFIVAGIVAVPMAWCRYLCPLGVALWPFSRIGLIRLKRTGACIQCGKCDDACPWGIDVSRAETITSGECTLCLECTRVCPVKDALELRTPGGAPR